MGRPTAKELTERELEVMHVFWKEGALTAAEAREKLAEDGIDRAYVTIANLVRILVDKGYLEATNDARPFIYKPLRSFKDVSHSFLGDLLNRVFAGSREKMLAQLFSGRKKLTAAERALLEQVLEDQK